MAREMLIPTDGSPLSKDALALIEHDDLDYSLFTARPMQT